MLITVFCKDSFISRNVTQEFKSNTHWDPKIIIICEPKLSVDNIIFHWQWYHQILKATGVFDVFFIWKSTYIKFRGTEYKIQKEVGVF
jgi:hypothetical protein